MTELWYKDEQRFFYLNTVYIRCCNVQEASLKYVGVCTMVSAVAGRCAYRGLFINWMSDAELAHHCQGTH